MRLTTSYLVCQLTVIFLQMCAEDGSPLPYPNLPLVESPSVTCYDQYLHTSVEEASMFCFKCQVVNKCCLASVAFLTSSLEPRLSVLGTRQAWLWWLALSLCTVNVVCVIIFRFRQLPCMKRSVNQLCCYLHLHYITSRAHDEVIYCKKYGIIHSY